MQRLQRRVELLTSDGSLQGGRDSRRSDVGIRIGETNMREIKLGIGGS